MFFDFSRGRVGLHAHNGLGYGGGLARVAKKIRAGLSMRLSGGALSVPSDGAHNDSLFRGAIITAGRGLQPIKSVTA